jgi:hypothetical protein
VSAPAAVRDACGPVPTYGRGALLYPDVLGSPPEGAPRDVTAAWVAEAAAAGWTTGVEPRYLRRPDAVVPGERKRVLGR